MKLNEAVTRFLENHNHPLSKEIHALRSIILSADNRLAEDIKWNGPNYSTEGQDRITMKIQPPKNIQLIFHRGAKVLEQPRERLLKGDNGLLTWRENDRAIATFTRMNDIEDCKETLQIIIRNWILATSNF